jgi:SAM-dependent methyltransferase
VDASAGAHLRKDGFDIARCPACGLLFRVRMPTRAELDEIYGDGYFCGQVGAQGYGDYLGEAELHRDLARRRLRLLEQHARRGSLLDVGAAAGFFVAEARARGWDARGLDVSAAMVRHGCEELAVPLRAGTLEELPPVRESLDVVTMWDYLEHALDPDRDLRLAAAGLRARGLLALSTGDVESPVARLSGSRWHLLTPRHHNYFFSIRSLRALLDRTGFDVTSVTRPGARYSLRYLGHKLGAGDRLSRGPLGRVAVPVNLRDIVTVLATRR